jgi:predicted dehydrogenase
MQAPIEAVMLGAGNRGLFAYGPQALRRPHEIRFTAVAEPDEGRRRRFAVEHGIPRERQFRSADELYARGRIADSLFNCSSDGEHLASTLPALALGYHVMLEKPMAATLDGSVELVRAAERSGSLLTVAHVLRYTAFFSELHRRLAWGALGDVITAEHRENVSYWHMAHSFVRGNWRSTRHCSPMILSKCCHDLDLLFWNLGPVARLGSFGALSHYRADRAPSGAPPRCTEGCPVEESCPFYAPRLYLTDNVEWPVNAISEDLSLAARRRALETGPYGRCVYACDNDVVDHQTVSLELASGATAVLVMHGHSHEEQRTMRYDGTRGTLRGRFFKAMESGIEIHDHRTGRVEQLCPDPGDDAHGGGDAGLVQAFVRSVRREAEPGLTGARESLESHLLAFAAEEARSRGTVVDMTEFRRRALAEEPP